jgi:hypothetical protein
MSTGAVRYYSAVVTDNADPDELGRIRVICPELFGDHSTELPQWVPPRVPAGSAPGAGWWFVPPVDAVVFLEETPAGDLRWSGAAWGGVNTVPAFLAGNYPRRAGFTSPEGGHALALDDDAGLLILVVDPATPDGVANYVSLDGAAGEAKIGLATGALFTLNGSQAVLMTPAGDTLMLDSDNGITIAHQAGAEYLALSAGVASLAGADVQIIGGAVTITGQGGVTLTSDPIGLAPTEPLVLGTSFLTDLATFLTSIAAAAVEPSLAPAAAAFLAKVSTSLSVGAPHLSAVSSTE